MLEVVNRTFYKLSELGSDSGRSPSTVWSQVGKLYDKQRSGLSGEIEDKLCLYNKIAKKNLNNSHLDF